jgi:quinoprotein glucose dehydrogenase
MPLYLAFYIQMRLQEGADLLKTNGVNRALTAAGAPYAVDMKPFLSPLGIPCPAASMIFLWAPMSRRREIVWKRKNGTVYDMTRCHFRY